MCSLAPDLKPRTVEELTTEADEEADLKKKEQEKEQEVYLRSGQSIDIMNRYGKKYCVLQICQVLQHITMDLAGLVTAPLFEPGLCYSE